MFGHYLKHLADWFLVWFFSFFSPFRNPNEIYSLLLHYFVLTAGSRDCMFWLESAIVAR